MRKLLLITFYLLCISNYIYSQEVINNDLYISKQLLGGLGSMKTSGVLNWNDLTNTRAGSGYTLLRGNTSNGPANSSNYFHPFNFEYNTKNGSGNITQLAIPYGYAASINEGIYLRGRYSNSWTNWVKVISENLDGNVGIGTLKPEYKFHVTGNSYFSEGSKLKYTTIGRTRGSSDNGYVREAWVYQYGGQFEWVQGEKLWNRSDYRYNETGGIIYTHSGVSFFQIPRAELVGGKNKFTNSELGEYTYLYSTLSNGNVGIGTKNTTGYKLSVAGKIRATEVKVYTSWADYVFEEDYKLKPLEEVEQHIKEHKHLPDVPSAKEVEENGVNVGETEAMLLRKIEELTLYTIEQEKRLNNQESVINEQKELLNTQQQLIRKIIEKLD